MGPETTALNPIAGQVACPPADRPVPRTGLDAVAAAAAEFALLSTVFEAVPLAIYATDADGRVAFANHRAASMFGGDLRVGASGWVGLTRLCAADGSTFPPGRTPMQQALRERHAIRGVECTLPGPLGGRIRILVYATPLFANGTLIGAVNLLVELGEQERANYLEQRLAAIVECSEDAIISKDLNGIIATWNRAAERLFGYTAEEAIGRPIVMLIPEDRRQEEVSILDNIRRGTPVARYETLRQRKDGTLVPIALTVSPLRDAAGRITGASNISRDISDQLRVREQQTLVLNEMSHRVKNILAVAGGLIGLSARSADDPKAMAKDVQERLGAYSRAHELTRSTGMNTSAQNRTTLHTLLDAILAPYIDDSGAEPNIVFHGEDVTIDSNATASLALVLHEFTTNAAKYGALSVPSGRIAISCRRLEDAIALEWQERGGPAISGPPSRQGFGSVLAVKTVEGQLGGTLDYQWRAEGVRIAMTVPQDRLS